LVFVNSEHYGEVQIAAQAANEIYEDGIEVNLAWPVHDMNERNGSVPACGGYHWIFNLPTCYAGSTGRIRPRAALLYIDTIGRWRVVDETACLTWEHDLTEGTEWFYPLCAYG
jgi:hypothetical protein